MADSLETAIALYTAGDLPGAERIYRQLIAIDPADVDAQCYLAELLRASKRFDESVVHFRAALEHDPDYAEGHCLLGATLRQMGKDLDAIDELNAAIRLDPELAEAHFELAQLYSELGYRSQAIEFFQSYLQISPENGAAWRQLGNLLNSESQWEQAADAYRHALQYQPASAEAQHNLGVVLYKLALLDPAIDAFRAAAVLDPKSAETLLNLGLALTDTGRSEEAVDVFRQVAALKPNDPYIGTSHCYSVHFHPGYDAQAIFTEHRRWAARHADPMRQQIVPQNAQGKNDLTPDRRLRVGFVSPDFRVHPVGRFLLPLYEHRDRSALEIFSYASVLKPDEMTDTFRELSDQWREVTTMGDGHLAQMIRDDRIDILVDLTMHMRGSRLMLFASKPAPVQVTYLAYCSTTGLSTIDYRLSDPYLDPPGADESCYSEKTVRLPHCYWCYQAPADAPPVTPPVNLDRTGPSTPLRTGPVTFGSLNNFNKVNSETLAMWVKILRNVPDAHMLIHAMPGTHRDRIWDSFAAEGVAKSRVNFIERLPMHQYFQLYAGIDIALDTYPYGGGTTTCDSLWMGVPVITRRGGTAVSRGSYSILSNLGLGQLVATTADEYISIATSLATDRPQLATLRATLRERLRLSPVMDAARFARDFEEALRAMWRTQCS